VYINHIKSLVDWDGNSERQDSIELFNKNLPDSFWLVEISVPQLFPANERKLGDVVINAQIDIDIHNIYKHLLYVRLPGAYYMLGDSSTTDSNVCFNSFPSELTSHVSLLKFT